MEAYEIPAREERNMHGVCCHLSACTFLGTIDEASAAGFTIYLISCSSIFVMAVVATRFVSADTKAGLQRYTILGPFDYFESLNFPPSFR